VETVSPAVNRKAEAKTLAPLADDAIEDEDVEIVPVDDEEQEQDEAAKVRAMKAPYQPTAQEIADHEPYHVPYRAWCVSCVRGRGKNMEHQKMHADLEHLINTVSMDYYFQGQEDDETLKQLCIRDHRSGRGASWCPAKAPIRTRLRRRSRL
jgi:hypothetical protein